MSLENSAQFEKRKKDHIRIALEPSVQADTRSGLEKIKLIHEALPDFNFKDVKLKTSIFKNSKRFKTVDLSSPIFISSMTAGHEDGKSINLLLAKMAQEKNWLMGVGSQRKELFDDQAKKEWQQVKEQAPKAKLVGNIGITQLIETKTSEILRLIENLDAKALFVHLNPLQEVLQKEGTPFFKGGLKRISEISKELSVPVIVKEVGCGFSVDTLKRLADTEIYAVDVAGLGGTHWGRIEGQRADKFEKFSLAAETFKNWGITTVESVLNAKEAKVPYQIWASGGVRSGLDVAKLIALGVEMVGLAQPLLKAVVVSEEELGFAMERLEYELQIAMFCTGCEDVDLLKQKRVWSWI